MDERSKERVVLVSSAEFALKSSPVRRSMEQRLIDDLKFAMIKAGIDSAKIEKNAGRVVLRGVDDSTAAAVVCAKVFGVAYAAPATRVNNSLETIKETIAQLAKIELLPSQSFAIRCHRSSPSLTSTRDVEIHGGAEVLKALREREVKVKLNHPDRTIFADLSGETAYIYSTKIPGPGGLPISSQWKMLAVLDSGPLSLFAAYVMMRRGCLVQLLIPSTIGTIYSWDRQLTMAQMLRNFVTRQKYDAFVIRTDHLPYHPRHIIRLMSLEVARLKRFRGVILADITGPISPNISLNKKSQELGLPIFTPLIGCEREELNELCRTFGITWEEVNSELSRESIMPAEQFSTASSLTLETVSL